MCPCFKGVVHVESITLGHEQVSDCIAGSVICEGDEETTSMAYRHRGRSSDVSVDFVAELSGLLADVHLWDRLASGTCIYACIAVLLH